MAESETPQLPVPPEPGAIPRARSRRRGRSIGRTLALATLTLAVVIAGCAILGLAAGVVWSAVAPRALLVVVGRDSADVVNPETSAFIAADGWYSIVCLIGGAVCGVAGYVLAVRRYGAAAMAALMGGAVAAALLARWVGEQLGGAGFAGRLAVSRTGTTLRGPLELGSHGALAFWALATGLTAGGIEAVVAWREHRRAAGRSGSSSD